MQTVIYDVHIREDEFGWWVAECRENSSKEHYLNATGKTRFDREGMLPELYMYIFEDLKRRGAAGEFSGSLELRVNIIDPTGYYS
jgi:hypothetical protein